MGWPAPSIMAASTSATVASPRSTMASAAEMFGMSRRLTMKPGVSMHETVVLPVARAQPSTRSKTAGSVWSVLTTSTRRMSCTGLK